MKRIALSLALALSLMLVFASAAGAAPHSVKPLSTCSSVITRGYGTANTSDDVRTQTGVQELKNSDGTTCAQYRTVLRWMRNFPDIPATIDERFVQLEWLPGNSTVAGSVSDSITGNLSATNSWQYFYGPWTTISCNGHFLGMSEVHLTSAGGAWIVSYSYGQYASC
jgi:hypothetical protein